MPGPPCGGDGAGWACEVGGAVPHCAAPLAALFCSGRGHFSHVGTIRQGFVGGACEWPRPFAEWGSARSSGGGGPSEGAPPGPGGVRGEVLPLFTHHPGEAPPSALGAGRRVTCGVSARVGRLRPRTRGGWRG